MGYINRWRSWDVFREGFILFKVNGRLYLTYGAAVNAREAVPQTESVGFIGLHIRHGWCGFYYRIMESAA